MIGYPLRMNPGHPSSVALQETSGPQTLVPARLLGRVLWLAALFVLEVIVISTRLDTQALEGRRGLSWAIGALGPHILQSVIAFATVFLGLAYTKTKGALAPINESLVSAPVRWSLLAGHIAAMAAFAFLSALLFGAKEPAQPGMVAFAWLAAGLLGIATALFFFIPLPAVRAILLLTRSAIALAAAAACITPLFVIASARLWKPAAALTFEIVRLLLWPFVSTAADPVTKTLGTQKFSVTIAPACSGLEGMGLMLLFGILWLFFFHRDYRFPHALLLLPVGMGLMFLLNSVRIAALILIGNAGAPGVATGGFHSQAGWIAFNGMALAMACLAHRVPWISTSTGVAVAAPRAADNPTAKYLVPFLAILAASMIGTAVSSGFEWLYPLRFFAALGALAIFRRDYSALNWRFGWLAAVIGGAVFALWLALDRVAGHPAAGSMPAALAAWSAPARITWIVFRTLAAAVTVPIAEELAFRGFLLRRLIAADFESISPQRWTLLALFGSSLVFGFLHGDRWIAGTVAGILYAAAQKWRGRIGDAVMAHAITNALIAAWVLWGGHWSLW